MASVLGVLPNVRWFSLGIIVLLVLLRMVFRRELVAAGAGVALFTTMATIQTADPLLLGASSLVFYLAHAAITMRFGLVMLFSFIYINVVGAFVAGFTVPAFATSSLVIGLVAVLAPGVFGFYTATRGRKASGWLDA